MNTDEQRRKATERMRRWRKNNPEKVKEQNQSPEKTAQNRAYYQANKEKVAQRAKVWKRNNPDKVRESNRKYQQTHPETEQAKKARYRAAHPEKDKEYRDAHPESARERKLRRRAKEANSVSSLTAADERAIKKAGCFFADETCAGPLTIAHDTPVANGGNTTRGNTFCLCRKHNQKMATKSLKDKLKQLFLL